MFQPPHLKPVRLVLEVHPLPNSIGSLRLKFGHELNRGELSVGQPLWVSFRCCRRLALAESDGDLSLEGPQHEG